MREGAVDDLAAGQDRRQARHVAVGRIPGRLAVELEGRGEEEDAIRSAPERAPEPIEVVALRHAPPGWATPPSPATPTAWAAGRPGPAARSRGRSREARREAGCAGPPGTAGAGPRSRRPRAPPPRSTPARRRRGGAEARSRSSHAERARRPRGRAPPSATGSAASSASNGRRRMPTTTHAVIAVMPSARSTGRPGRSAGKPEREVAPRQRDHPAPPDRERQAPEGGEGDREPHGRAGLPESAPLRPAEERERGRESQQGGHRRERGGMGQDRQRGQRRGPARNPAALDPRAQREREERQPGETEACRQRSPSEPGLDSSSEVGGEREREEGPGQREPPVAHHAHEERVGRETRREEDDRAEQAIDSSRPRAARGAARGARRRASRSPEDRTGAPDSRPTSRGSSRRSTEATAGSDRARARAGRAAPDGRRRRGRPGRTRRRRRRRRRGRAGSAAPRAAGPSWGHRTIDGDGSRRSRCGGLGAGPRAWTARGYAFVDAPEAAW